MEKKTIGHFIAALRKANGMTQKELAEKLNVSDKSVSRWERDETCPDLMLIPVIAEIFGVSADEILRGERKSSSAALTQHTTAKSEKQIEHILNSTLTNYRIRSIICIGVAFAGLIAAMMCNFGFNRAYVGFLVGCLFYLASGVCEAVFTVSTFSSLGKDFEGESLNLCKKSLVNVALKAFSVIAILFAISLPLVVLPWDTHLGISGRTWIEYGAAFGGIAVFLCIGIAFVVNYAAVKSGVYLIDEAQQKKNKIKLTCTGITLALMLLTAFANALLCSDYSLYAKGTVFYNYEDFTEYMAQKLEWNGDAYTAPETAVYYNENGQKISQEEAHTREIVNSEGKVVCSYLDYNHQVVRVRYPSSETCLPITIITQAQMQAAQNICNVVNLVFVAIYVLEIIGGYCLYLRKQRKT